MGQEEQEEEEEEGQLVSFCLSASYPSPSIYTSTPEQIKLTLTRSLLPASHPPFLKQLLLANPPPPPSPNLVQPLLPPNLTIPPNPQHQPPNLPLHHPRRLILRRCKKRTG